MPDTADKNGLTPTNPSPRARRRLADWSKYRSAIMPARSAGPAPSPSMRLGRLGEELAYNQLISEGYSIIGVNVHISRYEIDIIARDGECLVFVEVKTRSGARYGTPAQAVTFKKRRSLTEAALRYLQFYNGQVARECQARFDVVEVISHRGAARADDAEKYQINHIKNAFDAEYAK